MISVESKIYFIFQYILMTERFYCQSQIGGKNWKFKNVAGDVHVK